MATKKSVAKATKGGKRNDPFVAALRKHVRETGVVDFALARGRAPIKIEKPRRTVSALELGLRTRARQLRDGCGCCSYFEDYGELRHYCPTCSGAIEKLLGQISNMKYGETVPTVSPTTEPSLSLEQRVARLERAIEKHTEEPLW